MIGILARAGRVGRGRRAGLALVLALTSCVGCDSLLERALERRGGPLRAFTRAAELYVSYGFPGLWRWEAAYLAPDRVRLTLVTASSSQHYVFDGGKVRSYVGGALVTESEADIAAFRTVARWLAVTSLVFPADAEQVTGVETDRRELPEGAVRGLAVRFHADAARYVLGFDAQDRLVAASGPIEIPGLGVGRLSARFEDFRRVDGAELPFVVRYRLNDERFFEERVSQWRPGQAVLDPLKRWQAPRMESAP
jgi:hypothetical protein